MSLKQSIYVYIYRITEHIYDSEHMQSLKSLLCVVLCKLKLEKKSILIMLIQYQNLSSLPHLCNKTHIEPISEISHIIRVLYKNVTL